MKKKQPLIWHTAMQNSFVAATLSCILICCVGCSPTYQRLTDEALKRTVTAIKHNAPISSSSFVTRGIVEYEARKIAVKIGVKKTEARLLVQVAPVNGGPPLFSLNGDIKNNIIHSITMAGEYHADISPKELFFKILEANISIQNLADLITGEIYTACLEDIKSTEQDLVTKNIIITSHKYLCSFSGDNNRIKSVAILSSFSRDIRALFSYKNSNGQEHGLYEISIPKQGLIFDGVKVRLGE